MTHSMNDEAVYRTAPAAPGLLNKVIVALPSPARAWGTPPTTPPMKLGPCDVRGVRKASNLTIETGNIL